LGDPVRETGDIANTIYTIKAINPTSKQLFERVLLLNEEQKKFVQIILHLKSGCSTSEDRRDKFGVFWKFSICFLTRSTLLISININLLNSSHHI